MTGNEYQNNVMGFNMNYPDGLGPFCPLLLTMNRIGVLSSTMVDILNKPDAAITNTERDVLCIELGEILMELTRTIHHSGLTLDEVMQKNIDINNAKRNRDVMMGNDIFKTRR